jgi:hypothetical protein
MDNLITLTISENSLNKAEVGRVFGIKVLNKQFYLMAGC